MDEAIVKRVVEDALKGVLDERLEAYYVDREKHFQHHQFLEELIQFTARCKGNVAKAIVNCFVYGLIGLIVLGFIFWGKVNIK